MEYWSHLECGYTPVSEAMVSNTVLETLVLKFLRSPHERTSYKKIRRRENLALLRHQANRMRGRLDGQSLRLLERREAIILKVVQLDDILDKAYKQALKEKEERDRVKENINPNEPIE